MDRMGSSLLLLATLAAGVNAAKAAPRVSVEPPAAVARGEALPMAIAVEEAAEVEAPAFTMPPRAETPAPVAEPIAEPEAPADTPVVDEPAASFAEVSAEAEVPALQVTETVDQDPQRQRE